MNFISYINQQVFEVKSKIAILIGLFVLGGCTPLPPDTDERLGQFTAVSSFNVRNLNYNIEDRTASYTKGKACYQVNPQTLTYLSGPQDNLLQRAMDDAIRNGQSKGIDGDLLVNARIERKTEHRVDDEEAFFQFIKRFECLVVEGDLVKINTITN